MTYKTTVSLLMWTVILFALPNQLAAQKFELNPYAGGVLTPSSVDSGSSSFDFKEEGIYGIRGTYFLTKHIEIEGNFGYINHFEFEESDPESRGYLWEAGANYRFDLEKFKPFVSFGVGGITTSVDEDAPEFQNASTPVFGDGDTFFTFSYGGGVKAPKLWGPVCLRVDARARTIPNLHSESTTWLELTGGITLSF